MQGKVGVGGQTVAPPATGSRAADGLPEELVHVPRLRREPVSDRLLRHSRQHGAVRRQAGSIRIGAEHGLLPVVVLAAREDRPVRRTAAIGLLLGPLESLEEGFGYPGGSLNDPTLYGDYVVDGRISCLAVEGFDKGSLLIADGRLIILGENGKLALAKATPDEYHEEASYDFRASQKCWTVPSLAEGKLYVRIPTKTDDGKEEDEVVCLKVK